MADQEPDQKPEDQPIKLVVSVTKQNILVWSITGKEGTLKEPRATVARVADVGKEKRIPAYDYKALNEALREIAKRRWGGKKRAMPHFQAILMADGDIPYGTIIATMDAMRCTLPASPEAVGACLFPADKKALDEAQKLVGPPPNELHSILERTGLFDPDGMAYDADQHALFHDILFSKGFE
jgi:hypothetical protein